MREAADGILVDEKALEVAVRLFYDGPSSAERLGTETGLSAAALKLRLRRWTEQGFVTTTARNEQEYSLTADITARWMEWRGLAMQVRQVYDDVAEEYARRHKDLSKAEERALRSLLPRGRTPRPICLDACCGVGRFALYLAQRGCDVVAFDFSRPMLEEARARVRGTPVSPVLVQADIRFPPFRPEAFDLVACGGSSIDNVPTLAWRLRVVRELTKLLKPKGILYVTASNRLARPSDRHVLNPLFLLTVVSDLLASFLRRLTGREQAFPILSESDAHATPITVGAQPFFLHVSTIWEVKRWFKTFPGSMEVKATESFDGQRRRLVTFSNNLTVIARREPR